MVNLDALRFLAAMAVLWSHAFSLSEGSGANEPLRLLSGGQTTLGTVAVAVFFIMSGYLITRSFERSGTAMHFLKARVLRIYPALIVAVALLALVLGPAITTVPLAEYFTSRDLFRFTLKNASLLGFFDRLPGVFEENPLPWVNGSLWTLPIEAGCYLLVLLLGVAGLLNRYVTLALFVAGLVYLALLGHHGMDEFALQDHRVDLGTKFLAGAVLYQWRVPLEGRVAGLCALVAAGCLLLGGFWLALPTAVAYATMYLALTRTIRLPDFARYGDLSYGIYVYAWPVEQLVVMWSPTPHWLVTASAATPITIGLAFASWHLVEKLALAWKDRRLPFEDWLGAGRWPRLRV